MESLWFDHLYAQTKSSTLFKRRVDHLSPAVWTAAGFYLKTSGEIWSNFLWRLKKTRVVGFCHLHESKFIVLFGEA